VKWDAHELEFSERKLEFLIVDGVEVFGGQCEAEICGSQGAYTTAVALFPFCN
jgi:hypothetical protein